MTTEQKARDFVRNLDENGFDIAPDDLADFTATFEEQFPGFTVLLTKYNWVLEVKA